MSSSDHAYIPNSRKYNDIGCQHVALEFAERALSHAQRANAELKHLIWIADKGRTERREAAKQIQRMAEGLVTSLHSLADSLRETLEQDKKEKLP